jgi:aspartate aminotransferase-like enzyme
MENMKKLLMIPGPTNVPERIMKARQKPIINHRGRDFHALYERIEEGLKYLYQTKNYVFPLTSSGTLAVEAAIANITELGSTALVVNNGEFGSRMAETFRRYGANTVEISADVSSPVIENLHEIIDKHMMSNKEIKYVGMVYSDTSTAIRNPIEKVADVVKLYGKIFIVDAVSALGGDYLATDKLAVDFVASATQKCLACPPGVGMVSVSERAWKMMEDLEPRSLYCDLKRMRQYYDERRETPFTPDILGYYALEEGLNFLKEEGLENRIKRHYECSRYLRNRLKELGLKLLVENDEYASKTVTAAYLPENVNSDALRMKMEDEYGIDIAGGFGKLKGKIVRIATMGVITKEYVDRTIEALENSLKI